MQIQLNIAFDTMDEMVAELRRLATLFASVNAVDTARHLSNMEPAPSVDTAPPTSANGAALRADTGRAKGSRRKTEADGVGTEPAAVERVSEATDGADSTASEPEIKTEITKDEIVAIVSEITAKYVAADTARRVEIKAWRDAQGLAQLSDMKPEHVPAARELLATLGA